MIRARLTHGRRRKEAQPGDERGVLEIETGELSRLFVAPPWLRDAGIVAWLLVGIVLVLVGAVWLLALTSSIVIPVVTAAIIASVGAPVVAGMQRRHVPRAAAAGILLLGIVALGVALAVVVLGGITSQSGDIGGQLQKATDRISQWLRDLGVGDSSASHAESEARSDVASTGKLLLNGLAQGVAQLASLAAFAALTALSLFFLLKDGPGLRSWVERHSGIPAAVAHTITGEMQRALRGYFGGVTIVAAFNGVVIGLGALILGVPLAGTIAIVTFVGGYVPYLGAWIAGGFAVLIALGGQGPEAAAAMAVIALLGNGVLQQVVQPFAFGAALDLHPLAVLIVTIGAGSLFGMIGLVLAAPVTSAIVRISHEVARARAAAEQAAAAAAEAAASASG
jgi:putative heme transporter